MKRFGSPLASSTDRPLKQRALDDTMGSADAAETQTCPFLDETPPRKIIERNGDLHLKVGQNKCIVAGQGEIHQHTSAVIFVVDSKAVCRATKACDKMLHGGSAESSTHRHPAYDQEVLCPEDEPDAMEIILDIAHSRFDRVRSGKAILSNGLALMYNLMVLSDKYDLTKLFRPWARGWVRALSSPVLRPIDYWPYRSLERRVWIFWELGHEEHFYRSLHNLAYHTRLSPTGRLQVRYVERTSDLTDQEIVLQPHHVYSKSGLEHRLLPGSN